MLEQILKCMNCETDEIQRIQTAHRLKLIEKWNIAPGAKVLEIGCGQGDTTAALGVVVGERGFVHGVDIASPDYGAPETLGQARQRLCDGELGKRMRMDFETDVTSADFQPICEYDVAVLSHCLWYFASSKELEMILRVARKYAKRLCLAEWCPLPVLPEQIPHFHAVEIQAICNSFEINTNSNIRTLFYPAEIQEATANAGWQITSTDIVYSPDMQDGVWEVSAVLYDYPEKIKQSKHIPEKLKELLLAQIEEMRKVDKSSIKPLRAVCMNAE